MPPFAGVAPLLRAFAVSARPRARVAPRSRARIVGRDARVRWRGGSPTRASPSPSAFPSSASSSCSSRVVPRSSRVVVAAAAGTPPSVSHLRPPARAFELAEARSPPPHHHPTPPFAWFVRTLALPLVVASALAVFTACVAGFLVAVRELVRACREATIASRAVARCAESIDVACAALGQTLARADLVLEDVDKIGATTASVLETASREAGVLQRRLSDLPSTASRTLMEAITQQYSSPLPDRDADRAGNDATDAASPSSQSSRGITIGSVIDGERDGARWIGGAPGVNFSFKRTNRFRVGEYVAVPRTDRTYTWGVIELNDRDYSIDEDDDDDDGDDGDDAFYSGDEDAPSCVWPPRDPDAIPETCVDGSSDLDPVPARAAEGEALGWIERRVVAAFGPERSDAAERWVRSVTGLTQVEEGEYKVVVELDTSVYSFKIMNAGDLGKREDK